MEDVKGIKKKRSEELVVEIPPEGVEVEINKDGEVIVGGGRGELRKKFKPQVKLSKKNNSIILTPTSDRRRIRALLGTSKAEIENMIRGVKEGIVYKMKVVYSHFPMNLKIQGNELIIENFLGEKHPRKAKILEGVEVEIKGRDIEVRGVEKEKVGQTAANIEQATKIKNLDPRVFQDGCYIISKDGKEIK